MCARLSDFLFRLFRSADTINCGKNTIKILIRSRMIMLYCCGKDFMARDLESCKKCMEVGAITQKDAERLNRLVCLVYEGYLAMIRDGHYTDEQVQEKVILFIDDVDWLVMQLAKDLKGYQGYGK